MHLPRSLLACPLLVILACSGKQADGFDEDGGADPNAQASSVEDSGPSPSFGDGGDAGAPAGRTIFYAHTNDTLYEVNADDPKLTVTRVGAFDCVGSAANQVTAMTDIAVDRTGKLYGVSQKTVFLDMQIQGTTVACTGKGTNLSQPGNFYGASFAPAGTLDPQKETLVIASSEGALYSVNTATGALTRVGIFGNVPANDGNGHTYPSTHVGNEWELSGDIVFLDNGGKPVGFAAVRDCPNPPQTTNCNKTDTLIEIDVTKLSASSPGVVTKQVRGQVVKAATCNDSAHTAYGSMYGIAAFKGDILGFSRERPSGANAESSLTVRIDNNKGTACLVSDATPQAPGGWAGAGVTTEAPVVAPPPK